MSSSPKSVGQQCGEVDGEFKIRTLAGSPHHLMAVSMIMPCSVLSLAVGDVKSGFRPESVKRPFALGPDIPWRKISKDLFQIRVVSDYAPLTDKLACTNIAWPNPTPGPDKQSENETAQPLTNLPARLASSPNLLACPCCQSLGLQRVGDRSCFLPANPMSLPMPISPSAQGRGSWQLPSLPLQPRWESSIIGNACKEVNAHGVRLRYYIYSCGMSVSLQSAAFQLSCSKQIVAR